MILHIDMDAFYASVEERENPRLVGRPLIVGGTPQGRGVVAAANYVVRKFGVHSAMPTATALRLCPQAIVIPPRMAVYAEISRQIREVFLRYTPLVEPLSLDEAFLDIRGSVKLFGSAEAIARQIKDDILRETGLVASIGVAPNKFLAKIASDLDKPDALVVVSSEAVQAFLDPLPVGRIWGVGKVTGGIFQRLGIATIGDLRRLDPRLLEQKFGQQGAHFARLARGIDDRAVVPDREAKSISHETTFATNLHDLETLRSWLLELTEQVGWRLRQQQRKGRTVNLKLRFADFRTVTRAESLPHRTNVTQEIWDVAAGLLDKALGNSAPTASTHAAPHPGIRLIGIGVSNFAGSEFVQKSLFEAETEAPQHQQHQRLDEVADAVRARFGSAALNRGSGMLRKPD